MIGGASLFACISFSFFFSLSLCLVSTTVFLKASRASEINSNAFLSRRILKVLQRTTAFSRGTLTSFAPSLSLFACSICLHRSCVHSRRSRRGRRDARRLLVGAFSQLWKAVGASGLFKALTHKRISLKERVDHVPFLAGLFTSSNGSLCLDFRKL